MRTIKFRAKVQGTSQWIYGIPSAVYGKTLIDYTNKANELNAKYPNLKAVVTETWDGKPQITVCNSDKAKTLTEMYPNFKFNF